MFKSEEPMASILKLMITFSISPTKEDWEEVKLN
jgi:hypothetical protein